MNRRQFLATAPLGAASWAAPGQGPNILFILADDLGYGDLGCYGQRRIRTPHLDGIAADGMRFTRAYAGSTVCAPSRCALMTGLHTGHARVRDNIPHGIFLQPDDLTVAKLLKRAGYRTGAIGKWSLGNPGSWGVASAQGFDYFFGYLNQDHAHMYYPEHLWENDREVLLMGNRAQQRKEYAPDVCLDKALGFLSQNRQSPFFLYYAPTLPHWSDFPRNSPMSQDVPSEEPYAKENWPEVERKYAAMVTRLDAQVGALMDRLRALGLEQNTLVLFTSDNGPSAEALHKPAFFNSGGGMRGVKRDMYEGAVRVPFLARWKGTVRAGAVNEAPIAFWDLLPTAAEMAGLPVPPGIDGISFLHCLRGEPRRGHDYLYWEYGHAREKFSQGLLRGKWKAVRNGSRAPVELYDLETDPAESRDVSAANRALAEELGKLMESARTDSPEYPVRDRS